MHRRGVRVILVVGLLGVLGLAGYQVFRLEETAASERRAMRTFDADAWRLLVMAADLSGTVRSYVAEGQGERFWLDRAAEQLAALNEDLLRLRGAARTPEGARALSQAAAALEAFRRADQRAREYVANGHRLMASDVIFSDGLAAGAAAARQVGDARIRELAAADAALARLRARQLAWLLGAAALAALVALLLAPAARSATDNQSAHATTPAPPAGRAVTPADLKAAADLCTDLGRVAETADLAPLLERAAGLLDASGLVVWLIDQSGTTLRPLAAHGYTAQELDRMGAVSRDADNAVGIAFRSRKLQIVPSTERDDGALVAPLMTPTGCAGVFSAEVRRGTEGSETICALTVILAAQIAALIGTAPQAEAGSAPAARATSG